MGYSPERINPGDKVHRLETIVKVVSGMDEGSLDIIAKVLLYEEINIRGTLNMMETARQEGVKKFVYASSSSVYGDHPVLP